MSFWANLTVYFFVAMGSVIGGAMVGGIAAVLVSLPPATMMVRLAEQLKLWALVSTLGGTMDTLHVIETGVLGRAWLPVGKQLMYIIAAFFGCQTGFILVTWLAGGEGK
ncbi:sporulation membrane protein YtrH [Alicyclobacillus cellulosilyticus]|uniref:Sporulation membrane protein YtrH n=1 Tax=Alicyclobacillus cellulosilyticus TaxID=1003997 RepID=A0A917K4S0_9BACL|nr:YtrH family sporulation protein [Alicyclobacillus cellulosilyticus]GGI98883.1 sporulation membrane protein YtrH [Alicyclobacillus cellulosilyticus]